MRTQRGITIIMIGVFALAFGVRLAWILEVQHPLDAIYSDMGGYVERAERLLFHMPLPVDPRVLTIYPWGAHVLMALEFQVVGRHAVTAIAVAHAIIGAVPAPCMVALSLRLVPSRAVALLVGVIVALWYPQVAFAGFFLSEMWFSAAIALHAVLTVREWRRPYGRLAVGLVSAIAFVVRPQFLMTWGLDMLARAISLVRRGGLASATGALVWLSIPMAVAIGASSVRLHHLSGHWGVISENDEMRRLFAETDICEIHSTWSAPDGETIRYWFALPSRQARGPMDSVTFDGFISDPKILRQIRLEKTRGVPWTARVVRTIGNVRLLVTGNLPWPESNYKDPPWRLTLQTSFRDALLYAVLPLCGVGLMLGRHNRTAWVAAANLGTAVFSAAIFFSEARYHVPYDPFAILLAVAGAYEVVTRLAKRLRLARRPRPIRAS
jgi:hypothetical protein